MKKLLITTLMLMSLSACSGTNNSDIASMYSGSEGGSWLSGSICNHCSR